MALQNNFLPQTSLVFGVRDFIPQIEANARQDREGLQNAFKFGTQIYDAIKNRQIAEEMNSEDPDYKKIDSLAAQRINNPDTSFSNWRWKRGQDQAIAIREKDLERIKAEKQKNKEEQKQFLRNKISATLPTMSIGWNTSPEQIQQFKNTLAGLKTEAMNSNLTDQYNDILNAEAQLNGQLPQQRAQMAMDAMTNATNLFNVAENDGGFGKDPKKYHDYLLQQYTQITRDFPEAKYDPAFNKAFRDADKLHRKTVKDKKVRPSGRR